MNYQRSLISGIDKPIYAFQTYLYDALKPIWSLTDSTFNMYGRVYRNQTEDGYLPELFIGGEDYTDTLFDDTLTANAFFGVGETIKVDKQDTTADVFLVFMVNLNEIKPGNDRNDASAHYDVQNLCQNGINGFILNGFITGIQNCFKEYSGFRGTDAIKFRDQHPLHCFRLNFKLTYNINNC